MVEAGARTILVLGASGLIGRYVTDDLRARGFAVIGIARKFSAGQRMSAQDLEMPLLSLGESELARLITDRNIDVVVNCLGVLQDGPGSDTSAVHRDFVARLLAAIGRSGRAVRLVHISIPGAANDDRTAFSVTKREAERLILASGIAYAILRPGFVVAPSAYGGSAMLRALAALPVELPANEGATPFQPVAVEDVAVSLAGVIAQFRNPFGTKDWPRARLPSFLLDLGTRLADFAARLGWMSPMRSTAVAELRRRVAVR